jgi:hypothetical protein
MLLGHLETCILLQVVGYVGQGKRILNSEQMDQVVIVPPGFEPFSADTAF